ncbi:hypothetical protein F4778DRAFT_753105 [Xylariomycetidae sp. FL2044]|nr:hypothetical protein F4778DRAFT_753105 [Xylariomycetidae sp. FL2044]
MASELAPRLHLAAIIRIALTLFGVAAFANVGSYLGPFWPEWAVYGATVTSWVAVAWNIILFTAASIHPYLQRFTDGLPFPVKITVRERTILSYGDSDEDGDGILAPISGKLFIALIDIVLATLLLVFMLVSRDYSKTCTAPHCFGETLHVRKWILNSWLTVAIFEYALALVQISEALGIWYSRRYLRKKGQISLA